MEGSTPLGVKIRNISIRLKDRSRAMVAELD